jgi:FkbM family methyltransferase
MNISGIPKSSFFGKLIRFPLRLIPKDLVLPILQGRFRGKKWIVGAGNHGNWLGSYEFKKRLLFERLISTGSVVYDLGGFTGYYTILASVLVGPAGRVYVFEPLPRNLHYLKQHLTLNQITNVSVFEAAVSNRSGRLSFQEGVSSARGRLDEGGELVVEVVALDELIGSGSLLDPQYMKIDVEGAELRVLEGARQLLERSHPTIFMDTHGIEVHDQCCRFLVSLGYQLETIDGKSLSMSKEIFARYPRYPAG